MMTNNTMIVQQGANVYANRTNKTVPDYAIPSRFRVSINTPDVTWGDTSLTTQIPISGTETVSDCSVITGWTCTASDSVSVNSSTFKPDGGTDGALNLIKAATGAAVVSAYKTTTSVDGTAKDFIMWFYIKDATALAKFKSSGTALVIRFGSDSTNYYYKNYTAAELATGWNYFKLAIPTDWTGTTLTPTIAALDYTYIAVEVNNNSDTFAAGDVIFDAIRVASATDYYKAVDSITFNETEASSTITSKLTITEANGFLINGLAIVNADASEKLILKSKIPNNSKDVTDLFKFTAKVKVRNINQ